MTNIIAPAKLTLSLRVTGVREDGFHLIDAEMVSLDVHDVLTITEGESGMSVSGPFASGVPTDDNNLVTRALQLCGKTAHVHLEKNIPHGGGLGGGSADAAAILRWAEFDDLVAASRIGADVPFCMVGGRARVSGIGEIISPLVHRDENVTLITPPFGVSTPAVYRAWDDLDASRQRGSGPNDLETPAIVVEPRLADWRERIGNATGVTPILAGSGATWWVRGHFPDLHEKLPEATVVLAKTIATL
ncbi:MAG: 4-(cytidine 5'-diphospho)-2-C-methyl-D-erythritol kinase [Actinobacteria bacterium]|nr:4-(cytidine 5'-diphospho)-2-C-methyl-D-erythritol kinase [Actinomycetota bacterium]